MTRPQITIIASSLLLSAVGMVLLHSQSSPTILQVRNATEGQTEAFFTFGADSIVRPSDWVLCMTRTQDTCGFPVAADTSVTLPTKEKYLNATVTFGGLAACGSTKAELIGNPTWYSVMDISLVDGYDSQISIEVTDSSGTHVLAPNGRDNNEQSLGVYPYGCDICVARQNPPCDLAPGTDGCKSGTQYAPTVPCQYQGPDRGGGGKIVIVYSGEGE